jgi:hypothetical protein
MQLCIVNIFMDVIVILKGIYNKPMKARQCPLRYSTSLLLAGAATLLCLDNNAQAQTGDPLDPGNWKITSKATGEKKEIPGDAADRLARTYTWNDSTAPSGEGPKAGGSAYYNAGYKLEVKLKEIGA